MAMQEMIFGGRAVLTEAEPTSMQKMAGMMWAPMLLMGLMIVFASLGLRWSRRTSPRTTSAWRSGSGRLQTRRPT